MATTEKTKPTHVIRQCVVCNTDLKIPAARDENAIAWACKGDCIEAALRGHWVRVVR